ncbi:protein-tyrosine phosphatase family protein [Simkania negevensis]|uniref:Uncharacterized protein n=1 Tax=Simkania negevensis (strain ATCC VR-1471 / DSM 27360 / Z) TaxID=331113 RepID=F8L2Y1_SIMNZ|nr:hypothetical protein [Simkania negevensis]CCB87827.1 hypothetical protein SNE_B24680 [Simkania negevensis Z]
MTTKTFFILFFTILTSILRAGQNDWEVELVTLSAETISLSSKYQALNTKDPGFHKTIIRITNLPDAKTYFMRWNRSFFSSSEQHQKFSKKDLFHAAETLGENVAVLVISSRGFLPGEKVYYTLETVGTESKSLQFSFIPQPIVKEVRNGKSKLIGELILLEPARYELDLEGVSSFEKLKLLSRSSEESIEREFVYTKPMRIGITPGVIGKNGGVCNLSLTRQKGDYFTLQLPWGDELLGHLSGETLPTTSSFSPIHRKVSNEK